MTDGKLGTQIDIRAGVSLGTTTSSSMSIPSTLLSNNHSNIDVRTTGQYKKKINGFLDVSQVLGCGVMSGFLQAFIFNPWDRALYLSLKNNRPFMHSHNFLNPFAGVMQTITQRGLSAGLYFPLEEIYSDALRTYIDTESKYRPLITTIAGTLAGSTNGFLLNPLSYVKYHYWGKTECGNENVLSTAKSMYKRGGISIFFVGTYATISRDFVFGGAFSLLRHELLLRHPQARLEKKSSSPYKKMNIFLVDLVAASVATILSSPLNYVRDMSYSSPLGHPIKSIPVQIYSLWQESLREPTLGKQVHLLQRKLRIGWGTARVGCGMAVGSWLYSLCSSF